MTKAFELRDNHLLSTQVCFVIELHCIKTPNPKKLAFCGKKNKNKNNTLDLKF
jgi:hypothetical protein